MVKLNVPLVVRLNGNAADEGKKTLLDWARSQNFNLQVGDDMGDGAQKAANIVKNL